MPKQGPNQTEYARMRGVTRNAVLLAIRDGDCILHDDRSVNVEESDPRMDLRTARGKGGGPQKPGSPAKKQPPQVVSAQALNEAKLQKLRAQARQEEIKASQLEGSLIAVKEVKQLLMQIHQQLQVSMLTLPDNLAPQILHLDSVQKAHGIIDSETRAILEKAANSIESIPSKIQKRNRTKGRSKE